MISINLLAAVLEFASKHVTICDDERHIILQAKSSLLYNSGEPWSKRTSSNLFDVTMGSFDGTESCELVGTYLLHNIKDRFGLGVTKASPWQAELIKKEMCSIFPKYGLKVTIEANTKVVNFLDVKLNLAKSKYLPYNKPGNIPLYINKKSNHPPRIIKNIPKSINKRLSAQVN